MNKINMKGLKRLIWYFLRKEGYLFHFQEEGKEKQLAFKPITMTSVHTEYDYRKKGECITLSTLDNTYFLYPCIKEFNVTKVQFATEELYRLTYEKSL